MVSHIHEHLLCSVDVVRDLLQPGGLVCNAFVEDYTGVTSSFEKSGSPVSHIRSDLSYEWQLLAGFSAVFGGPAAVRGAEHLLQPAIEAHKNNWNMTDLVQQLHFTDDFVIVPGPGKRFHRLSVDHFGITENVVSRLATTNAPNVYIVGGYCDSSSVKGATRLFERLQLKYQSKSGSLNHKLILGPWTHTGRRNCSPFSGGSFPQFENDLFLDILAYLDCSLKKKCWGPYGTTAHLVDTARRSASNFPTSPSGELETQVHEVVDLRRLLNEETTPIFKTSGEVETYLRSNVHYWVTGLERWFAASSFPPEQTRDLDLDLKLWNRSTVAARTKHRYTVGGLKRILNKYLSASLHWLQDPQPPIWFDMLNVPEHGDASPQDAGDDDDPQDDSSSRSLKRENYDDLDWYDKNAYALHTDSKMSRDIFFVPEEIKNSAMEVASPETKNLVLNYEVDYNAFLSGFSRWTIAKQPFRMFASAVTVKRFPPISSLLRGLWRAFWHGPDDDDAFVPYAPHSRRTSLAGRPLSFITEPVADAPVIIAGAPLLRFALNLTDELQRRSKQLRREFFTLNSTSPASGHAAADDEGGSSFMGHTFRFNQLDPLVALDVTVFAYLEDVDEKGHVEYVTEGQILLSHRPTVVQYSIPQSAAGEISGESKSSVSRGLEKWDFCAIPPTISETPDGWKRLGRRRNNTVNDGFSGNGSATVSNRNYPLRQPPRTGSPDVIFQTGDHRSHRFSVGKSIRPKENRIREMNLVKIDWYLYTWSFLPGHRIRLSLVGADRANFHWTRTQSKENLDLYTRNLLFKGGSAERLRELQRHRVTIQRPRVWSIPSGEPYGGLLKLPLLLEDE